MGSVVTLFLLFMVVDDSDGTGGRVIKLEDDAKLRAMVSAFCRQTQNLNISQQLE